MKKNLKAKFSNITVYQIPISEKSKNNKRAFHSLTGECIDNFIYLFGLDCNCICSINKNSGDMDIQYGDDSEPFYKEFLYIKSISYKKNIYFISDRTNTILKFNPSSNQKQYLHFEDAAMDYITVLNGARLFLLPVGYAEKLVYIDLESNKIRYSPISYKSNLITSILGEAYIFGTAVVVDQCCYRGSYVGPYLQKFYMDSGNFEYIKVKGFERPIQNITYDGKLFWILSRNDGTLISWNEETNNIVCFLDIAKETQNPKMTYARCEYYNEIIYVLEEKGSCIIEISIKNETFSCYDCTNITGFELRAQNGQAFSEFIKTDEYGSIYFLPWQSNGIVSKDKAGNIHFYMTENDKILGFAEEQQQNENICTLSHFNKTVQEAEKIIEKNTNCGQSILSDIMEIM